MKRKHYHKFNARITEADGIKFHSKKEARYYEKLKRRQEKGLIVFFLRQVPFYLPGNTKLVIDFQEFRSDGTVAFVDVKGFRTEQYKAKKRMVEALYPIEIEEV